MGIPIKFPGQPLGSKPGIKRGRYRPCGCLVTREGLEGVYTPEQETGRIVARPVIRLVF
jgi:hypothetical protein